MFQEHPLAHDRARYAQGGIPWNSYSSVCPKTSLWSMRVYWMKVHMRFCECACLRGGCVWRQSVWVWVHSCRDDVTSWKLIYSAYRWGHWFLELGSGSLNEEFPAVMASCYGALRFLCVSVCVCAGVWGGGGLYKLNLSAKLQRSGTFTNASPPPLHAHTLVSFLLQAQRKPSNSPLVS